MGVVEQIANEAKVSPNTVLRVLAGKNKELWPSAVRRATEIREIAQRLGYLPNGSARAMRYGKFNAIALVLSVNRGRSFLPIDLFNGIADALHELGMRLLVTKLDDEELASTRLMPVVLRELSCDGLLINYTDHVPVETAQLLARHRMPSVWINRKQPFDCVYYEDHGGAAMATEHLLALEHRRIEYLDFAPCEYWDNAHYSRADRYEGYARAMRQAGLQPTPRERFAGIEPARRLQATCELLKRPDRPTAILSYDSGARVVHAACITGLSVPRDLSVMTFGPPSEGMIGPDGEEFAGYAITTVRTEVEAAGRKAVELLRTKMAAPETQLPACVLPLRLDAGDTCAVAPSDT
jgi:LacI family transcriptional regulator